MSVGMALAAARSAGAIAFAFVLLGLWMSFLTPERTQAPLAAVRPAGSDPRGQRRYAAALDKSDR